MRILCNSIIYDIDDKFVEYSPYLSTLCSTQVNVEKEDEAYKIDDLPCIDKYIAYIQGKEFTLEDDERDDFFTTCNFFGHDSDKYSIFESRCISMKMHDDWVRDNLYKLDLLQDPFYDLVEIPINKKRRRKVLDDVHIVDNMYIAGGAAMYMAKWIHQYKDVDVFTTSKNIIEDVLSLNTKCKAIVYEKYIGEDEEYVSDSSEYCITKNSVCLSSDIQIILRLYKAPTEIVHGFDVDCCGILYDPSTGKLWATKRALWAFNNKMNIFDPARASPSYVYRLTKYQRRGYTLHVPIFDTLQIDEDAVHQWKEDIRMRYFKHIYPNVYVKGGVDEEDRDVPQYREETSSFDKDSDEYFRRDKITYVPLPDTYFNMFPEKYVSKIFIDKSLLKYMSKVNIECPWGQMIAYMGDRFTPKDTNQDRLFLSKMYCTYSNRKVVSDYELTSNEETGNKYVKYDYIIYREGILYIPPIVWKEQNPMEQVTSTFEPEPIGDLEEWLRSSQFFQ